MTTPTANPTVPWAVGGGADNAIEHARMIPWAIYQGSEGVLGNLDLQVVALTTPGASVQVNPGGYVIVARGLGQNYEAYMGKYGQAVTVAIAPNNAGTSRSDLVILRIEDNHVAGEPWSAPPSNDTGPYRNITVVQGVPSTTRAVSQLGNSWSAIALARIDIPAFTSTITNAMIVPVRTKVSPPSPPVPPATIVIIENDNCPDNPDYLFTRILPGAPSGSPENFTSSQVGVWRDFPTSASWLVPIPKWASRADIIFAGYTFLITEDVWGAVRVNIDNGALFTDEVVFDANYTGGPGPEMMSFVAAGSVAIPSSMRGKNKKFKIQAKSNDASSSHTGIVQYYRSSVAEFRIFFKEQC
jgi:hypothetical protein